MARKGVAEFGNLVVTYGEGEGAKGLLDQPEFFFPVFFDPKPLEAWNGTFLIHRAEIVQIGDDERDLGIAFEFLKVHDVKSEQQLVGGDLKREPKQIRNDAPSGVGVLVLRNHRLVYVGRTAGSPSAKQFAATVRTGIKQLYTEHLFALKSDTGTEERDHAVAEFKARTPRPTIEYVPILGKDNIAEALKAFKTVKLVSLDVLAPNPEEIRVGPKVLQNLRDLRKEAGAKTTRLQHSNPDGLDRKAVQKQLEAAADDDLTKTKVKGTNHNDNDEEWSDAKLSLHVAVNVDLTSLKKAAKPLVETMNKELEHLPERKSPLSKVASAVGWLRDWTSKR